MESEVEKARMILDDEEDSHDDEEDLEIIMEEEI